MQLLGVVVKFSLHSVDSFLVIIGLVVEILVIIDDWLITFQELTGLKLGLHRKTTRDKKRED
tara:strand:- start:1137 stop:1322 length:186 start_codon:yes stop_codon:yes gene_type:complete